MKNLRPFSYIFLLVLSCTSLFGQNHLERLSYEQLKDSMLKHNYPKDYSKIYLNRAKRTKDTLHIAKGYYNESFTVNLDSAIIFSDSIIELTKNFKNNTYPAAGYMLKAYYLDYKGHTKEAYNLYLKAYQLALNNNNLDQQLYIEQVTGELKSSIGQYEQALKIFKKQYNFLKSDSVNLAIYKNTYINVMGSITNIYLNTNSLDSAEYFINKRLNLSKKTNDTLLRNNCIIDYAQLLYLKGDYNRALDSFQKLIPLREFDFQLNGNYYYTAKIYQAKGDYTNTINYFNKLDSLYNVFKDPYPELIEVYKTLYDYHLEKGDKEKQLYAIKKMIEADSLLTKFNITLNTETLEQYKIPKLKEEKAKLLQELNEEHSKTNYIIIATVVLSLILITLLIKLNIDKKKLKTRFENLVQNQDSIASKTKTQKTTQETTQKSLHISKDIIDAILEGLTQFEDNKDYLNNQITLVSLAKQLNTNPVYLSKIINHYKGKSLSNYLTNLRINYCVSELKHNTILRKYTIKALAQEMGFRNAESFSKAFKKQTGLNPSYYIKALNNLDNNQ